MDFDIDAHGDSMEMWGKYISQIVIDSGAVYVATEDGVFKTNDGGNTWGDLTRDLGTRQIRTVAITANGRLVCGTLGYELYKYRPPVKKWHQMEAFGNFSTFWPIWNNRGLYQYTSLLFHPTDPDVIYFGTFPAGIYKSTDGGSSWKESNVGWTNDGVFYLVFHPEDPNIIYAGTYNGVNRSLDAGAHWEMWDNGWPGEQWVFSIDFDPRDPMVMYACSKNGENEGTGQPGFHGTVMKSINGGETWFAITTGLDINQEFYKVIVDKYNPDILYLATQWKGVFISRNGGISWTAWNEGLTNTAAGTNGNNVTNTMVMSANGLFLYFGTAGSGVFRRLIFERTVFVDSNAAGSNDGSSWQDAYNYLQDALAMWSPGDQIWVADGIYKPDQGGGKTPGDRGATFQLISGIVIKGGYAGYGAPDPNERDIELYETILSGDIGTVGVNTDNSYHVVTGSGTDETAILDGFTITAGNANGGSDIIEDEISHWGFDEGSGTIAYDSTGGNDGTLYGSPVWDPNGRIDGALKFDGLDDYVKIKSWTGISGGHSRTVCAWIKTDMTGVGEIVSWGGTGKGEKWLLMLRSTGELRLAVTGGGINGTTDVADGQWHHVAAVLPNDGTPHVSDVKLYVDGNEESTTFSEQAINTASYYKVKIGVMSVGTPQYFNGKIDEVRIYNRDLSAEEILRLTGRHRNYGGGMYNFKGDPTVNSCTFSGNSAGEYGGGIAIFLDTPTITNCTFSGNSAGEYGGGICSMHNGNATIINCTFAQNSAANGKALACDYGPSSIDLTNCILWDGGNEIWNNDGSTITITYSNIKGGYPGQGNINVDPLFVDADNDDYHLLPASPCIDAGDNTAVPPDSVDLDGDGDTAEPIPFDLAGNPRFVDQPEVPDTGNGTAPIVDMGAYEANYIEVKMKFTPQALNLKSKGKWLKAHFVLPGGFLLDDVDTNTPAVIVPLGNESDHINVFINEDGFVEVEAAFSRSDFCGSATSDDVTEVIVIGLLNDGRNFYGTDTIRIIDKSLEHVSVLVAHWLEADCGKSDWCNGADLDQNTVVNFVDFALFEGCCIEVIEE
jgi:predicted outer membrane repeat protein